MSDGAGLREKEKSALGGKAQRVWEVCRFGEGHIKDTALEFWEQDKKTKFLADKKSLSSLIPTSASATAIVLPIRVADSLPASNKKKDADSDKNKDDNDNKKDDNDPNNDKAADNADTDEDAMGGTTSGDNNSDSEDADSDTSDSDSSN